MEWLMTPSSRSNYFLYMGILENQQTDHRIFTPPLVSFITAMTQGVANECYELLSMS